MESPIILTSSAISLFNTLIKENAINLKKLYKHYKQGIDTNIIDFKNIKCIARTSKNNVCLNKCIENSKYCIIHDPVMKQIKKQKRIDYKNNCKLLKYLYVNSREETKINKTIDDNYLNYLFKEEENLSSCTDVNSTAINDINDMNLLDYKENEKGCSIIKIPNLNEDIVKIHVEKIKELVPTINFDHSMDDFFNIIDPVLYPVIEPIILLVSDINIFKREINKLKKIDFPIIGFKYYNLYKTIMEYQIKSMHINTKYEPNNYIKFIQNLLNKLPK